MKNKATEALKEKWKGGGRRIVILQRGWVIMGHFAQRGSECRIRNGSVVRRWGTTRGLGELASDGPKPSTQLDPIPTTYFHELTTIAMLRCKDSAWSRK